MTRGLEVCADCKRPIVPADLVWVATLIARQTHSSPEEWDRVPLHLDCRDNPMNVAFERASAKARGNDFARPEGIGLR
jgi:hypothetical protein